MPEFRHMRSGSLNTPNGGTHSPGSSAAAPRFDGPRSPPNTSHVPCKFFRQGACQAGSACPFSHDLGSAADTVCKYFAKGNCKFGPKCANIHVLPDGRRINYGKNGVTIGPAPINLAGRSPHPSTSPPSATAANGGHSNGLNGLDGTRQHPQAQPSTSALTNSLYSAEGYTAFPYDDRNHKLNSLLGHQPSLENGLPIIDAPYASSYGSPRDDSDRFGLALSPVNGLSVLDAPLPASFDSNGISNAARFPAAPWPSSVPSKFGFESSSPSNKDARTSDTLKLLHTSAFGSDHLTPATNSPPNSNYGNGSEEYFGKRAMHSSRFPRPTLLSASLPKTSSVDRDWTPDFAFDEDNDNLPENYVPENLQDLLTPAEKARRGSIRADESPGLDSVSKYGSPIGTSPSRWAPVFAKEDELSRSARGASAFGHVGSPLRNSVLAAHGKSGDGGSPRPPAARVGSDSLSMLSQQLQRSRLEDAAASADGSGSHLHPGSARSPPTGLERQTTERSVSSSSLGSPVTGRLTTPINEEEDDGPVNPEDFVFKIDEVNGEAAKAARKRLSSSMGFNQFNYAAIVRGRGISSPNVNGKHSDQAPVNGH